MAMVDRDGAIEQISVELCDAAVGDTVLVHAGIAIATLQGTP
jgi:hydrogenase maturation factor